MPQADPAERVVDRREPRHDAAAALQLRLQFGERDVGGRVDQPSQVGLIRREHGAPMTAIARRCRTARLTHALHQLDRGRRADGKAPRGCADRAAPLDRTHDPLAAGPGRSVPA